jgi:hypothetical protein
LIKPLFSDPDQLCGRAKRAQRRALAAVVGPDQRVQSGELDRHIPHAPEALDAHGVDERLAHLAIVPHRSGRVKSWVGAHRPRGESRRCRLARRAETWDAVGMLLAPEEAALFYRAWGALLTWVNDQRNIVPRFARPRPDRPIAPAIVNQVRKVVWADDALRERFIAEGAADLSAAERALIASWQHRVSGQFVILKHLQKHSIFSGKGMYAVRGLYSPFAEMFPYVPTFVTAVLLPFHNVITTDGLLESPPMQISFGGGARRMFNAEYSAARAASDVRTCLPWRARADAAASAPSIDPAPTSRRRRAPRRVSPKR